MVTTEKIFEISLLGTIFLLSFELSSGSSFYAVYVFLLATILSFCYLVATRLKSEVTRLLETINNLDILSKGIVTFFVLYLSIDFINFLTSDYKNLAISKYKVVLLMLFICGAIYIYAKNRHKEFNIFLSLGLCSIFICIISFVNYFIVRLYPIYYTLRLSLRSDYNMYSVAILTGLVCIFYYYKEKNKKPWLLYFGIIPLCSSCVVLSGSRRGFLFLITFLLLFLVTDILPFDKKTVLKKVGIYLIIALEIFCFVFISSKALNNLYEKHGIFINSDNEIIKIENETSYANRLKTISEGNFLTKRIAIWNEAYNEIRGFDKKSLVFGKGNGYDIYIYSENTNEEISNLYDMEKNKFNLSPHNFLLSDILCGGLIRLSVSIVFWVFVCLKLLRLIFKDKMMSFLYILPLAMVFANSFISGRYGFLYDKYFYIFLTLLVISKNQKNKEII